MTNDVFYIYLQFSMICSIYTYRFSNFVQTSISYNVFHGILILQSVNRCYVNKKRVVVNGSIMQSPLPFTANESPNPMNCTLPPNICQTQPFYLLLLPLSLYKPSYVSIMLLQPSPELVFLPRVLFSLVYSPHCTQTNVSKTQITFYFSLLKMLNITPLL